MVPTSIPYTLRVTAGLRLRDLFILDSGWNHLLPTARDRARRSGDPRVSVGTPELAFKVGEGIDNVPRFECSVAATNGDLRQDIRIHESVDRFIGLNRATADQCSRTPDCDDRSADKLAEQEIGRGFCSDLAQPTAPSLLNHLSSLFEFFSVAHCPGARTGKATHPEVDPVSRLG